MIRRDLPELVATLTASAPATRARVRAVKLQTSSGEGVRALDLALIDDQVSIFQAFQADLARTPASGTWLAVSRWAKKNNAMTNRHGRQFQSILRGLPPEERAALMKGVATQEKPVARADKRPARARPVQTPVEPRS